MNDSIARRAGFSLLELLVVLSVIGVIAGFAVPAFTEVMRGNELRQAAELVRNRLVYAHQTAVRTSQPVIVQFYEIDDREVPGTDEDFRAFEMFQRQTGLPPVASGNSASTLNYTPLTEIVRLPVSIKILDDSEYSTLISGNSNPNDRTWSGLPDSVSDSGSAKAFYFEFLPDGSTDLAKVRGVQSWHITLIENTPGASSLPNNYVTVQLDPINGNVRTYQPGF